MTLLAHISSKILNFRYVLSIIIFISIQITETKVTDLTDTNFDQHITTYEIVFVNFHAEWCPYSKKVMPVLHQCDQIFANEVNNTNRVLFARVDCDENQELSTRYKISKYPTLKIFINGKVMKKEYRGQRSTEALTKHIRELLSDPVVHIAYQSMDDMSTIMYNKSAVIGYFSDPPDTDPKYDIFRRVATDLRGLCQFFWVTNAPFIPEGKKELLAFKSYRSSIQSEYDFMYRTYEEMSAWSTYMCIPKVREINFENAEEIVEEGRPLVILFHQPYDETSVDMYREVVQKELINETSSVNFVTADATVFDHPLQHLNKSHNDLPLIAIDSFHHMYLFPKFEDLNKTHILAKFVDDLKTGKLHFEYHFGPEDQDMTESDEQTVTATEPGIVAKNVASGEVNNDIETEEILTPVAESVFKKLAPSQNRYSFLKDEL